MEIDKEILEDLKNEIIVIEKTLKNVVFLLIKSKLQEKTLFEKFGQVIDRLYGTAATLGMMEIANYCKMLKEVTYKCGQSDNEKGIEKTMKMMIDCIKHFERIPQCIHDKEELKKIRYNLQLEVAKGDRLSRSYFFSIKRTSCD